MKKKKYIIGSFIFLVLFVIGAFAFESIEILNRPVGQSWIRDLKALGSDLETDLSNKNIDVEKLNKYQLRIIESRDEFEKIDVFYLRYIPFTPFKGTFRLLNTLLGSVTLGQQMLVTLQGCQETSSPECVDFQKLDALILNFDKTLNEFQKVPLFAFPVSYREKLQKVRLIVDDARLWTKRYKNHRIDIQDVFGMNGPRTYLIALQNSAEARPMGGFIGSMIKVSFAYGKLNAVEFLDVHYFDYLSGEYLDAPDFLPYIDRMSVQEANIYPAAEASGLYMKEVFEKMGGPNIDGVVFVSLEILDELFQLVPEVKISDSDMVFTRENYFEFLQWELEKYNLDEYEDVKEPKKALFGFIQAMGEALKNCNCLEAMLPAGQNIVDQKMLQFYFVNEGVKGLFSEIGVNKKFGPESEDQDFFALYFSNYFNKANRFITKKINHTIRKEESLWHHELTISLDYTIPEGYEESLQTLIPSFTDLLPKSQRYIRDVFGITGVKSYLEVFFPKDARSIRVEGMEKENWHDRNFEGYPGVGMKVEFGDFGNTVKQVRVKYTTGVKEESLGTEIETQPDGKIEYGN